jgi:hypothetical protein
VRERERERERDMDIIKGKPVFDEPFSDVFGARSATELMVVAGCVLSGKTTAVIRTGVQCRTFRCTTRPGQVPREPR